VAELGVGGDGVMGGRQEGGGIGPADDESIGVGVGDAGLVVDEGIGLVITTTGCMVG
jgi:hypothetical protein